MVRKQWLLKTTLLCSALAVSCIVRAQAVELLTSGNFETPGGQVGDVPGWSLEEFLTGSPDPVDSAVVTGGPDVRLFLQAYNGGGPLTPVQGNFDNSDLPRGAVDGGDFLTWQRNFGRKSTDAIQPLPADGDATADKNVDASDFNSWRSNFGYGQQKYANARLTQTVPGQAGQTYAFQGTSEFEDNYSGLVTTLGDKSPFGQIPSPTQTNFKMEFLDASNNVLLAKSLDLRTENTGFFPVVHTPITEVAPAGTFNIRVTAEALNMAWNGTTASNGLFQAAFFNDFSLKNTANPGVDLLTNGDLNLGPPDALDFWNQVEVPATQLEILRTPLEGFSNHTPGGTRGVWLSAFFGAHPDFEDDPVDGIISQTVDAVAGGSYSFSGWTKFEGNYSGGVNTIAAGGGGFLAGMTSPTKTEIRLDFLDVNGIVIGTSFIDVKAARQAISGNANDNQWRQHTLNNVIAPAGTRKARLTAQMIDGVYNINPQQSAFFDDFSLLGPAVSLVAGATVPEPSSLVCLAIGMAVVARRRRRG